MIPITPTAQQAQMIAHLRESYGALPRMDPESPFCARLLSILDRADTEALKVVYQARIPFVSPLALNRLIRRGAIQ